MMRIGIDLDEVVADFLNSFLKFNNHKYHQHFKKEQFTRSYNLWETMNITKDECVKRMDEFYKSEHFKEIRPVHGSIYGAYVLMREQGNEGFIITSRPVEIETPTREFINNYFHGLISKTLFARNVALDNGGQTKADICSELGINLLIEDNLEYAAQCASRGVKVLVYECPWNQGRVLPDGCVPVKNWEQIREYYDKFKEN